MAIIGKKQWAIPEGYIPSYSHADGPDLISHGALCILNAGRDDADICLTIYFSDKPPVGPYRIQVPAQRTKHVRLNDLDVPQPIPKDTEFSTLVESDVPVVVQFTRLDSRQAENAIMTTIAFAND